MDFSFVIDATVTADALFHYFSPPLTASPDQIARLAVQCICWQISLSVFVHIYVPLKIHGIILCLCLRRGILNILGFDLFFHSIVYLGDPATLIYS